MCLSWKLEEGSWKREVGRGKLEEGSWKYFTENCKSLKSNFAVFCLKLLVIISKE